MTTPYVDPQSVHNPTVGQSRDFTWGDTVNTNFAQLSRMPSARCKRTTAFAAGSGGSTVVVPYADGVDWDTDAFWNTGANTRLTIPAGLGGRYMLMASSQWDGIYGVETDNRYMEIRKNNSSTIVEKMSGGSCQYLRTRCVGTDSAAVPGDYYEVRVSFYGPAGQALTPNGAGDPLWFSIRMLGGYA